MSREDAARSARIGRRCATGPSATTSTARTVSLTAARSPPKFDPHENGGADGIVLIGPDPEVNNLTALIMPHANTKVKQDLPDRFAPPTPTVSSSSWCSIRLAGTAQARSGAWSNHARGPAALLARAQTG